MRKLDGETIFGIVLIVLMIVIVILGVVFSTYAFVMYADKPITEIPMWALWFLKSR